MKFFTTSQIIYYISFHSFGGNNTFLNKMDDYFASTLNIQNTHK